MAKVAAVYKTGFCGIGLHEGTSPTGMSGTPLKVCVFWIDCGCPCHAEITKMYEMVGAERVPQQNPKYDPPKNTFKMPTLDERVIATLPRNGLESVPGTGTPIALQRDAAGILPPMVTRSFDPTPTGRSARGELESWVRQATDMWVVESALDPNWKHVCTPAWISEEIAKEHGVKAPSTGAVTAVLDRWRVIGFAYVERGPLRLLGYTEAGKEIGLEALKLKAKQKPSQTAGLERVTGKKKK